MMTICIQMRLDDDLCEVYERALQMLAGGTRAHSVATYSDAKCAAIVPELTKRLAHALNERYEHWMAHARAMRDIDTLASTRPDVVTIAEAAVILKCSDDTIRRMIRRGRLKAYRI